MLPTKARSERDRTHQRREAAGRVDDRCMKITSTAAISTNVLSRVCSPLVAPV